MWKGFSSILCVLLVTFRTITPDLMLSSSGPESARRMTIAESHTEYEWWLLTWKDSALACIVRIDNEGQPTLADIQSNCVASVYERVVQNPVCLAATTGSSLSTCPGYYMYYVGSHQVAREVVVELPSATATVTLEGCTQTSYKTICTHLPRLKITGLEPLPEYSITQIHYEIWNNAGVCLGAVCTVKLRPTPAVGEKFSFWAESSFGDSSPTFEALLRIKPNGSGDWQIDLLSEQSVGFKTEAFAVEWGAFPPLGNNPHWLSHPPDVSALASNEPYQYLAGQLIQAGIADASSCSDRGLMINGYASQCGLEHSFKEVASWQNRFDPVIFEFAEQNTLSPQLLKNLIAQESQFWPGEYAIASYEYGLARLTETGADTLLMWNESFYNSFCVELLSEEACEVSYTDLLPLYQNMLRGGLISRINPICETCEFGFDPGRASLGIEVLAQSLLASAAQVNQIYINLTGEKAGVSSTYEDLWRFTLVSYNAGPGCLYSAISVSLEENAVLDWANVSAHLIGHCGDVVRYVNNVAEADDTD